MEDRIIIFPLLAHVWRNLDTSRISGIGSNSPVLRPLIGFQVASTAEQHGRLIIVLWRQGQHHITGRCRVCSDSVRDIWVGILDVVLIVKDFCTPVGLDEDVARRKKESERVQIGGQSSRENVQSNRISPRGNEFVSRVVLTRIVDETSPLVTPQDLSKR